MPDPKPRSRTLAEQEPMGPPVPVGQEGHAQAQNPWAAIMALMGQQGQQFSPMDHANADLARLRGLRNDPQGDANLGYVPGQGGPGSPWAGPLQFNNQASQMSPEAQMATQGRTATNQWAQLGGVPSVDSGKLQGLMGQMTPTPWLHATEAETFADPKFIPKLNQKLFGQFQQPQPILNATGTPQPGEMGVSGSIQYPGQQQQQPRPPQPFAASANPRPGFGFNMLR